MTNSSDAFTHLPFEQMKEADVRAEVLDPLLRRLGYSMAGEAIIRREHALKYPFLFLGRKKPGKDLKLQGNADYTLEVAGHARWTLEAKAPDEALDDAVRQQAWSYAIHPEVQSSYFAISNGRLLELYATSSAWSTGPLLRVTYADLDSRFAELEAFLGPAQLARRHPNHLRTAGEPLGPNLRAFERVASGTISYHESSLPLPLLSQMQVSIIDGALMRDSAGKVQAHLVTRGPFRDLQAHIDELGLQLQTYVTDDAKLSVFADAPTVFHYEAEQILPMYMDPETFKVTLFDVPVRVSISAKAIGHLRNDEFAGAFIANFKYHAENGNFEASSKGKFSLRLA